MVCENIPKTYRSQNRLSPVVLREGSNIQKGKKAFERERNTERLGSHLHKYDPVFALETSELSCLKLGKVWGCSGMTLCPLIHPWPGEVADGPALWDLLSLWHDSGLCGEFSRLWNLLKDCFQLGDFLLKHGYIRKSSVPSSTCSWGPFDHRASSIQNTLVVGRRAPPSTDTPILMFSKLHFWLLDTASQCGQNVQWNPRDWKHSRASWRPCNKDVWAACLNDEPSGVDWWYNL